MIPLGVLASGYVAPAGGVSGVSFLGVLNSASALETYTFSGVDIGPASADRTLILCVMARPTLALQSVTVGGSAATADARNAAGNAGDGRAEIWRIDYPTGTTADVAVKTVSGDPAAGCAVAVYAITGYAASLADAATNEYDSATQAATVTATTGGAIFAVRYVHYITTPTSEWTNVTEDYDGTYATCRYTGGSAYPTTAGDATVTSVSTAQYYSRLAVAAYSLT